MPNVSEMEQFAAELLIISSIFALFHPPVKSGKGEVRCLSRGLAQNVGCDLRYSFGAGPLRELADSIHFPGPNIRWWRHSCPSFPAMRDRAIPICDEIRPSVPQVHDAP